MTGRFSHSASRSTRAAGTSPCEGVRFATDSGGDGGLHVSMTGRLSVDRFRRPVNRFRCLLMDCRESSYEYAARHSHVLAITPHRSVKTLRLGISHQRVEDPSRPESGVQV